MAHYNQLPASVDEFLDDVNRYIVNINKLTEANAKDIFDFIKGMMMKIHINITFEHPSNLANIYKLREKYDNYKDNKYVQFVNIDSKDEIVPRLKFLLSTNRHKADFSLPLVRNANGLIFVIEDRGKLSCRLLTRPSDDFNPKVKQDDILRNIDKKIYKIYPIRDGTTVSLSYDSYVITSSDVTELENINGEPHLKTYRTFTRGKWIVSTKNAFDADEMVWRGYKYSQVLSHVFSLYNLNFDKLHKNATYTIGFKHPAFHPFLQKDEWKPEYFSITDKKKLLEKWIIEAWIIEVNKVNDNDSGDVGTGEDILPVQKSLSGITVSKFRDMLDDCKESLKKYISHVRGVYVKDPEFVGKEPPVQLGYFLRAKGEASILVESKLWTEIRNMIYQLPFVRNRQLREKQEQNFKNMNHIILESYFNKAKHNIFIHIFPQFYDNYYGKFNEIVNALVLRVVDNLNGVKPRSYSNRELERIVSALAPFFTDLISGRYQTSQNDRGRGRGFRSKSPRARSPRRFNIRNSSGQIEKKLVKDMIMTNRYVEKFYDAIYQPVPENIRLE